VGVEPCEPVINDVNAIPVRSESRCVPSLYLLCRFREDLELLKFQNHWKFLQNERERRFESPLPHQDMRTPVMRGFFHFREPHGHGLVTPLLRSPSAAPTGLAADVRCFEDDAAQRAPRTMRWGGGTPHRSFVQFHPRGSGGNRSCHGAELDWQSSAVSRPVTEHKQIWRGLAFGKSQPGR
jgi:hypothetical protein